MKRLLFLVFMGATLATLAFAALQINRVKTFSYVTSTANDTAQITKLSIDSMILLDSFVYIDSFSLQPGTTYHRSVTYLTALQTMILTPTFDASTTYSCSLSTGGNATGFDFDATGESNLAGLISKLTDSINAVTGIKDTLLAEDSATYVKVISEFAQWNLPSAAKFTMSFAVAGGSGTLDTASQDVLTATLLLDSLAANINADDSASKYTTAANSGDTALIVTADQKGMLFFLRGLPVDTGGGLIVNQANVISRTKTSDTTFAFSMTNHNFKTIIGRVIVGTPSGTVNGVGLNDTTILQLYTQLGSGALVAVGVPDSGVAGGLPDTFYVTYTGDVSGVDTLFKDNFIFVVTIEDSTTDSSFTTPLQIRYDFILKSER